VEEKNEPKIEIINKGQWRAEEDIISILLLDNKEVTRYIFEHISTEDFANDHLREIFEVLVHQWEDMGHFSLQDLGKAITTDSGMGLVSKLSLQVIEQPLKYAAGCIYKMRKWRLDARYNEILRLMKEESTSSKSKSHYMKELTEIRMRISEVETERIKMFNINF
jgi:replicative DNA helicase